MARPSKSDADATGSEPNRRDEILETAARVLARKGLMGATVRDIGKEVGILSGSLYHHFASKDQMVLEVLQPVASRQLERYREAVGLGGTPTEKLRRMIDASVLEASDHPHATLIFRNDRWLFSEIEALRPLEEIREQILQVWSDVVERGLAEGEFHSGMSAKLIVTVFFDVLLSSVHRFLGPAPDDPVVVGHDLSELLLGGLCQQPAGGASSV